MVKKPFHICRTTLQLAVGTPRGLIFPGQALSGFFVTQSRISSGVPLGISTLKYFRSVRLFFNIFSTLMAVSITCCTGLSLYHLLRTVFRAETLSATEVFIRYLALDQYKLVFPFFKAFFRRRISFASRLLSVLFSFSTSYSTSAFSFLSSPDPAKRIL
jgi:hypothetical protein